jgi:hypothetical protein
MWCSMSNPGSDVAASTHGYNRWHDASLIGYGQSRRDTRDRYGLRRVKCHGGFVDWRCLPTEVVQLHAIWRLCR